VSFCVEVTAAHVEDERVGGKARSLARLAAAGLPVPRAFAVTTDLYQALRAGGPALPDALSDEAALSTAREAETALAKAPWPAGFADELAAALARADGAPGARFSVRSSAALEDRAGALGAGLFLSRTDVPAAGVGAAVREVLTAALAPAALAYAARRGLPPGALAMAVLVHPYTRGDAAGTAAFDPTANAPPTNAPTVEAAGTLAPGARARIVEAARALAAGGEAVELEWVATGDDVLFLQLRPYRAPARRAWAHAAALAEGASTSTSSWTWDAAHNPLPLSPAQAGLVALVDARCQTPFRQRVVGGYLFYAPVARPAPAASAPAALADLTRDADARLAALGPDASLEDALALFLAVYEPLFGTVQPAARAARDALAAYLSTLSKLAKADARLEVAELLRGVPSLATERARRAAAIAATVDASERAAAVAAYLALFGDEAPVWDVAAPTFAEDPTALHRLAAPPPRPDAPPPPPELPAEGRALLAAARAAAAAAEDDDVLYARVQSRVRRALLREGRLLQAANLLARAEDVFWLPLETVRRGARGEEALTLAAVTHAVATAREAHADALADPPPVAAATPAREGGVRGRCGSSGRAVGHVHLHDPTGAAPVPAGAILVARTLLPTELPLVTPAAIVVETGGVLGHVAAQARERALPALVDAPGAVTAFRAGDRVLVDADAGLAIRVGD
jgi:phosphohistidine swiveling domain-containing protein